MAGCRLLLWSLVSLSALSLAQPPSARADDAAASASGASPTFHVHQLDPDADVSSMKASGVKVHEMKSAPLRQAEPPPLEKENELLRKAGMSEAARKWDDLAKDVLFIRASQLSPEELSRYYPKLKTSSVAKLHELVRKFRERK